MKYAWHNNVYKYKGVCYGSRQQLTAYAITMQCLKSNLCPNPKAHPSIRWINRLDDWLGLSVIKLTTIKRSLLLRFGAVGPTFRMKLGPFSCAVLHYLAAWRMENDWMCGALIGIMRWPLGRERPAQEQYPRHPKDAQVIVLLEEQLPSSLPII